MIQYQIENRSNIISTIATKVKISKINKQKYRLVLWKMKIIEHLGTFSCFCQGLDTIFFEMKAASWDNNRVSLESIFHCSSFSRPFHLRFKSPLPPPRQCYYAESEIYVYIAPSIQEVTNSDIILVAGGMHLQLFRSNILMVDVMKGCIMRFVCVRNGRDKRK